MARRIRVGPGLPKTRNRAIDDARISYDRLFVTNTELACPSRSKRFNNNVGPLKKPLLHRIDLRTCEIDSHRTLRRIHGMKIDAIADVKWWIIAARIADSDVFYFDHLGAQISKILGAPWSRQVSTHIEHFDTMKRKIFFGTEARRRPTHLRSRPLSANL